MHRGNPWGNPCQAPSQQKKRKHTLPVIKQGRHHHRSWGGGSCTLHLLKILVCFTVLTKPPPTFQCIDPPTFKFMAPPLLPRRISGMNIWRENMCFNSSTECWNRWSDWVERGGGVIRDVWNEWVVRGVLVYKGGATNLKVGRSVHWKVGGQYNKNTNNWKKWGVHDPPPSSYVGTAPAGLVVRHSPSIQLQFDTSKSHRHQLATPLKNLRKCDLILVKLI